MDLIVKRKVLIVSPSPPHTMQCLSNLVPFQMLLLQLLKYFTKQIWLFLFYLYYHRGHFDTYQRRRRSS